MPLRCGDCLSQVPYQSNAKCVMEIVRDCPCRGLVWFMSWLPLAGAGHFRVNGDKFIVLALFSVLHVLIFPFGKD